MLWPDKPLDFCKVEGDDSAYHFGIAINHEIVCVASVFIDNNSARLRKFATLHKHQGKGIGSYMLKYLVNHLQQNGIDYLWFDARSSALSFYNRLGFEAIDSIFYKSNIAYFKMHKKLA